MRNIQRGKFMVKLKETYETEQWTEQHVQGTNFAGEGRLCRPWVLDGSGPLSSHWMRQSGGEVEVEARPKLELFGRHTR